MFTESTVKTHGIYRHSCINCGSENEDSRLIIGLPCSKCIPDEDLREVLIEPEELIGERIYNYLKSRGTLKNYAIIYRWKKELDNLDNLFNRATGSRLWSAQRTWVMRVLKNESFSIVSPTGTGKSIFGILMSIYKAKRGNKAYILVPTTPLVNQVYNRIIQMLKKLKLKRKVVYYHSRMQKSERGTALDKIEKGKFDILITTSAFLARKFESLNGKIIDFIFVDDVDSVLKSSKNIDRILILMGFDEHAVDAGLEILRLKRLVARVRDKAERERMMDKIANLSSIIESKRRKIRSVLVVSSATGRPRGLRVKLFRELLGFEVGTRSEFVRNIVDTYLYPEDPSKLEEVAFKLVKRLGEGGLIFVPIDKGIEYAEHISKFLNSKGISAGVLTSDKIANLEKFIKNELSILVGVAVYYGVMVRGLDLPERIRYALFVGVPRFKFSTRFEDPNPSSILRTLGLLYMIERDEDKRREIERLTNRLKRIVLEASFAVLAEIRERLLKGEPPQNPYERIVYEALIFVREELSRGEVIDKLKEHPEIRIIEEDGVPYILIPDVMTYIQASGRTSRMYVGGLTKGLSVIIVDDNKLLEGLIRRSKWVIEDIDWKNFEEINILKIIEEIDKDRSYIRKLHEGKIIPEFRDPIKTILLVVESPNKARTIANFFGKPSIRKRGKYRVYEVSTGDKLLIITASGGHIYDLITDYNEEKRNNLYGVLLDNRYIPIYTSIKRCVDTGYQFAGDNPQDFEKYCGEAGYMDKKEIVDFLRSLALEVDKVIIGTDPDSEGEKIGWDLAVLIRPYTKKIERVEFHEVTKKAIMQALASPRFFNLNLIESQIVRRIEDRWIGFYLSSRLMDEFMSERTLSAGRVQTPVLGWIIKRYEKWLSPENKKKYYRVFFKEGFSVEFSEDELPSYIQVKDDVISAKYEVRDVRREEITLNPPPPYITATLIEDASRKLRIGADKIMRLAQDLFEMGLITYHRTDSTRVSYTGQYIAKEYFKSKYPREFEKLYVPRNWGGGGAHECIRPTRPLDADEVRDMIMEGTITVFRPFTWRHQRLYDIIFKRFMASQSSPAILRKTDFKLILNGKIEKIVELYTDVVFPGFLTVNPEDIYISKPISEGIIYPEGASDYVRSLSPLYKQSDVIRLMREKRIGRPSTYAKIIEVILKRGYVWETVKNKYLRPNNRGIKVYNFLIERYKPMVSEERTRMLEEYMDKIEAGEADYQAVLRQLHEEIELLQKAD